MPLPLNPYVAGNPVGDSDAFIGRADVLREVVRVLRRPQGNGIVLFGQRRIGKTSVLQQLAAWLPREGTYHPVYFDLQDKADWPLSRVLEALARTVAHILGQPDPDLGDDAETTFRDEWLPAILDSLPEGCSLALLFDEFDVLADPQKEQAAAAFFPYLRGLLTSDPERLQFVFVIGRNVDDLDTIALSLFKGTPYQRVSLLSREDIAELVRLSEQNGTLTWPGETVERVWQLTNGHPFLTQQLCSHVWERAYDDDPDEPPTVSPEDVDAAVSDALDASRNTLGWLWDGLPPAERVVISALAEAGPGPITQDELERLLHESGVRVVIRELQNAPRLLQDWDLIEPAAVGYRPSAGSGYNFRVELLRRWLVERKPLSRVQEEMDRIEPVAESLYRVARGYYQSGQLAQAVERLREAIGLNPNHMQANQLLADILLAQGQSDEARQLLERLYEYQPAAARSRLTQALLALAQAAGDDDEQLALYERVLELHPTQPEAGAGKRRIWQQRGDDILKKENLEAALAAYREAGLADKVAEVEREMRRRDLAAGLQKLESLERERRYQDALALARELAAKYPQEREWKADLERLGRKTQLADLYQRGLGALQSGDRQTAQTLLAEVVALEPGYEEATRYLHLVVTGKDVVELQTKLEAGEKTQQKAKAVARAEAHYVPCPKCGYRNRQIARFCHRCGESLSRPSPITSNTSQPAGQRHLSSWNPLDHLRLLWWVLVVPQRLKVYREAFGKKDERRVGNWLASTLIWLPLFLLMLDLGLETIPHTENVFSPTSYLWISLGLCLTWMLTAWLGGLDSGWMVVVAAGVAVVTIIVTHTVAAVVAAGVAGIGAGIVALCVTFGMSLGVAGGVACGVAGVGANVMALCVVFGMPLGMITGVVSSVANGEVNVIMTGIMAGLAGLGVAGGMAGGIASIVKRSIKTGKPSWLARGAFGALLLAHAFLIWFSFLGGWRAFQCLYRLISTDYGGDRCRLDRSFTTS